MPGHPPEEDEPPSRGRPFGLYSCHRPVTLRVYDSGLMSPELLEPDIRRLVQSRIREGTLSPTTVVIPPGRLSKGGDTCIVCGFVIIAGRNEADVSGFHAHERCAVIWREESDRLL